MNARSIRTYLDQLCADLDAGLRPRPFELRRRVAAAAVPMAIGLSSLAVGGCPGPNQGSTMVEPPAPEHCADGMDNDGDGRVDCADDDCELDSVCGEPVAIYAAPPAAEANCGDGVDEDRDGRADCADDDCATAAACVAAVPAYAAPPPGVIERCGDGVDNDGDGGVDCADPDCADDGACGVMAEYGVPFEARESDCGDGVDNDGDGQIDLADDDCSPSVALYAAPAPTPTPQPPDPPSDIRPMYGVPFGE